MAAQTVCDRAGCGTIRNGSGTSVVCFTPATPPPSSLWGSAELQPAYTSNLPPDRDTTNFNEFTENYGSRNWFEGLEILEPGLVEVSTWRPDTEVVPRQLTQEWIEFGGVARKP